MRRSTVHPRLSTRARPSHTPSQEVSSQRSFFSVPPYHVRGAFTPELRPLLGSWVAAGGGRRTRRAGTRPSQWEGGQPGPGRGGGLGLFEGEAHPPGGPGGGVKEGGGGGRGERGKGATASRALLGSASRDRLL